MSEKSYEAPVMTVLGTASDLTEGGQKSGGTSDQTGLDGANSFTPSPSDVRLKRDVRVL